MLCPHKSSHEALAIVRSRGDGWGCATELPTNYIPAQFTDPPPAYGAEIPKSEFTRFELGVPWREMSRVVVRGGELAGEVVM
jgi:hypothetical protein